MYVGNVKQYDNLYVPVVMATSTCTRTIVMLNSTFFLTMEIEDLIILLIRQPPICSGSHLSTACVLIQQFFLLYFFSTITRC